MSLVQIFILEFVPEIPKVGLTKDENAGFKKKKKWFHNLLSSFKKKFQIYLFRTYVDSISAIM